MNTTLDTTTYYAAAELEDACRRVIAARGSEGVVYPGADPLVIGYDQSAWEPTWDPDDPNEVACETACCLHGHVRIARPLLSRCCSSPFPDDYSDAHPVVRVTLHHHETTPELMLDLLGLPLDADETTVFAVLERHGHPKGTSLANFVIDAEIAWVGA